MEEILGLKIAMEEARLGQKEGGIPIGAVIVSHDGKILGRGRNQAVQKGAPTSHAELVAFENAGSLPASSYKRATIYTTAMPCEMCAGAIILFGIKRVFVLQGTVPKGAETYLKNREVEIYVGEDEHAANMILGFKVEFPGIWKAQPWTRGI